MVALVVPLGAWVVLLLVLLALDRARVLSFPLTEKCSWPLLLVVVVENRGKDRQVLPVCFHDQIHVPMLERCLMFPAERGIRAGW